MTGEPFYASSVTPITSGSAIIGDSLQLGSGQDLQLRNMTVAFDFPEELTGLTLLYNKTRQSSITTEILEIASGAEAVQHG